MYNVKSARISFFFLLSAAFYFDKPISLSFFGGIGIYTPEYFECPYIAGSFHCFFMFSFTLSKALSNSKPF